MKIRLTQLAVDLDYADQHIRRAVAKRLGIMRPDVLSFVVIRRSIDARRMRTKVCFTLTVEAEIEDSSAQEMLEQWQGLDGVAIQPEPQPPTDAAAAATSAAFSPEYPPVVVGAGPAGLLAAWRLAKAGARPILIERGAPVEERTASVGKFWSRGKLDPQDNVLFGEGGAGLFSDGKLTARSKLRGHLNTVLKLLVDCGAPEEILIDSDPHVGSDRLGEIVPRLRQQIVEIGGDVRFHSRLEGLEIDDGRLTAVIVNGQRFATNHCLLATGHSARDVYEMLHDSQITLAAKSFAVGVRIEVPQKQIDCSQYGQHAGHPRLGAANFRLTRRPQGAARACYSFCTCPGGSVITCASSPGMLTSNGMSLAGRGDRYGNAGFLVPVDPTDFADDQADPLAGLRWQGEIEARAFEAGGSDYSLPACGLTDFLAGRVSSSLPDDRSCSRSVAADLHEILPGFVRETLLSAMPKMLRKLSDVRPADGIVYAAETRSSSPVRIVRDEQFQSPAARGLYPAGEGAGYAGGIVSSAIDGLRAAEAMLQS